MSDRLRVLFVNHTLDPRAGGAEHVFVSLLSSLPRAAFDLHVAVPAESASIDPVPEARYHPLPPMHPPRSRSPIDVMHMAISLVRLNGALMRLLRRERPAAVYANSIFALHFCALPAAVTRIPLIYHEHGLLRHRRTSLWSWLFRPLARRAQTIVAVSDAVAAELRGAGLDTRRIRVVHNAISGVVPELPPRRARGATEPFRIVQVANLHRLKGHVTVIRAVAGAIEQGFDVLLSLFGRPLDEEYLGELRDLARTLGVLDRVEFLGFVPNPSAMVARYDCFVVASDAESFGLVILESMAVGVPVVASAAGGIVEIVTDGVTGLLFTPGDVDQLVSCWRTLIEEPATAEQLAKNAHRQLAERFSADVQATRVGEAIRVAVAGGEVDAH